MLELDRDKLEKGIECLKKIDENLSRDMDNEGTDIGMNMNMGAEMNQNAEKSEREDEFSIENGVLNFYGSRIGYNEFCNRNDIVEVIAENANLIGDRAFAGCVNLKVVKVPCVSITGEKIFDGIEELNVYCGTEGEKEIWLALSKSQKRSEKIKINEKEASKYFFEDEDGAHQGYAWCYTVCGAGQDGNYEDTLAFRAINSTANIIRKKGQTSTKRDNIYILIPNVNRLCAEINELLKEGKKNELRKKVIKLEKIIGEYYEAVEKAKAIKQDELVEIKKSNDRIKNLLRNCDFVGEENLTLNLGAYVLTMKEAKSLVEKEKFLDKFETMNGLTTKNAEITKNLRTKTLGGVPEGCYACKRFRNVDLTSENLRAAKIYYKDKEEKTNREVKTSEIICLLYEDFNVICKEIEEKLKSSSKYGIKNLLFNLTSMAREFVYDHDKLEIEFIEKDKIKKNLIKNIKDLGNVIKETLKIGKTETSLYELTQNGADTRIVPEVTIMNKDTTYYLADCCESIDEANGYVEDEKDGKNRLIFFRNNNMYRMSSADDLVSAVKKSRKVISSIKECLDGKKGPMTMDDSLFRSVGKAIGNAIYKCESYDNLLKTFAIQDNSITHNTISFNVILHIEDEDFEKIKRCAAESNNQTTEFGEKVNKILDDIIIKNSLNEILSNSGSWSSGSWGHDQDTSAQYPNQNEEIFKAFNEMMKKQKGNGLL